jgi:glyoxylase-like metal-dependent hydrolase (beta-lactamase superfamily II)
MNSSLAIRLALIVAAWPASDLSGELAVRSVEIGPKAARTAVPEVSTQDRVLKPQAVSAVDISADGNFITVGTMAFSHDANVWVLAPDGTVISKANLPPWAPMQVATLAGGHAMAVGLAYSRVTSPDPTVWSGPMAALLKEPRQDDFSHPDSRDGQWSRWRYGQGDWRTGWLASCFGELFIHGLDWIFQPPKSILHADGRAEQLRFEDRNLLPTDRAARMTASRDGKQAAFGWLCLRDAVEGFPYQKNLLSVWSVNPNQRRWAAPPSGDFVASRLPDPAAEFPELLAEGFRLRADKIVPGTVATALAINRDGSRVALVEHGVWIWLRTAPAIGKWDPPIHALNFVPAQRGRLRVFDGSGQELLREWLPDAGLFEAGLGDNPDEVWCWPASWFARGMAGAAWLPVEASRRTVYRIAVKSRSASGLAFPDAIADCAVNPANGRALISCWDGRIYLSGANDKTATAIEAGQPARLAWSGNGEFAIAGTADGRVRRFKSDGKISWDQPLAVAEAPVAKAPPAEVVPGVPVFNVGRVGAEHAYVGDIWLIKSGANGILVDAAGTSSLPRSLARITAAGIERVTHVIQTHSHGDHAGGTYLWRAMGAKIIGPKSAALATTWLMPMLTDYGVFPPRPLDLPLPLARTGDETQFEVSGIQFRALLVPGHSFDLTVYVTELGGRRVAFTGDLGFQEPSDILHRSWGDAGKARAVVKVIKEKLLPWKPEVVFTGHDAHANGMEFLTDLVRRSENSLTKAAEVGK